MSYFVAVMGLMDGLELQTKSITTDFQEILWLLFFNSAAEIEIVYLSWIVKPNVDQNLFTRTQIQIELIKKKSRFIELIINQAHARNKARFPETQLTGYGL